MTAQPTADVEISIVSLGDMAQLRRCIERLPAACAGLSWRVSLVDNAPRPIELGNLLANVPFATVLRSEGRRGFAANQNLALSPILQEGRTRHVLILNDDTEPDAQAVTRLVRHADADPHIGAVTPAVRDPCGKREPDLFAWPTLRNQATRMLLPRLPSPAPRGSGWLNGAAMLVRANTLEEVGVFDPSFFLFFEETDLCLRMVRMGWTLDVCDEASLVHHRHGTTGQHTLDVNLEQQVLRSRYLYFRKHRGTASARALSAVSRGALALRAAKAAALTRRHAETSRESMVLWQLARYAPSRPTQLELRADRGGPSSA